MEKPIYLDNNTITRPSDALISELLPFYKRHWKCVATPYHFGKEPLLSVNSSFEAIRKGAHAHDKDRFIFTSCGAEAISQVFHGVYLDHIASTGKNHLLTTCVEEAPILMSMKRLEKVGCHGKMLPVNEKGQCVKAALEEAINPRVSLLSMSWASGLTGVIHPIQDLAEYCKEKEIMMHLDISDVLGKLYFRIQDLPVDFITFDGDRLHAPRGAGGLFIRNGTELGPLIADGTQQEGERGGSLNLPALFSLKTAFQQLEEHADFMAIEIARLRGKFENSISHQIPEAKILYKKAQRLPNTSAIAFPGVCAEALALVLAQQGVIGTFGGGRMQKLEHLLIASGIEPLLAKGAMSFALSRETTEEEIDRAVGIIVDSVKSLQACSKELI